MGQISTPATPQTLILTALDRLVASNSDGGLSPLASHIILLGQTAGANLGPLSNVIAFGFNALAGGVTDPLYSGTIVIGGEAFTGTPNSAFTGADLPNTIIGYRALTAAVGSIGGNVLVGAQVMEQTIGDAGGAGNYSSNVVIGTQAAQRVPSVAGTPFDDNVIIGYQAARGQGIAATRSIISCVIIGSQAANAFQNGIDQSVIIGQNAAPATRGANNTFVGFGAASAAGAGNNNICVGMNSNVRDGTFNIVIGRNAAMTDGNNSIIIGSLSAETQTSDRNIIIGNQPAIQLQDIPDQLFIQSVGQALIYGRFDHGNLMFGSTSLANQATLAGLGARNVVWIADSTRGVGAPTGGGFLESITGEARWVSTTGDERVITGVFTVATLPAAGGRGGSRAFVTDALAPVFQAAVAGGGAVFTPVYCDGAGWFVG